MDRIRPSNFEFRISSLTLAVLVATSLSSLGLDIDVPKDLPPAAFAAGRIADAAPDGTPLPRVVMKVDPSLPAQGYAITPSKDTLTISGGDSRGLLYGGLELAERIRLGREVEGLSLRGSPYIKRRGLKMNIPLDARCPSYDDSGTSARRNVEQVWSKAFWHDHLDRMAEHRYNTLTLWCNHPFTAMLKLEAYPDVALDDIAVPTYPLDDRILPQYMHRQLQDPANYRIVKKMPIEEKVRFWQEVMSYAKARGIDIYFITWNIWMHGADGHYGITESQTNDATIAYLRESVKQFVLTYPDLKGLGITCGEHMQNKLEGEYAVERWMWNTYGQGILDAKKTAPDREVHFIHRVWYTGLDGMVEDFIGKYPDPIAVGFKYGRARLYSVPDPPFFENQLRKDLERHGLSCWMNLRNDDLFHFRWGDPEYVRDYLNNLPPEPLLAGYHMGSDGYVWGREFASTSPESPRQLEIDKHWYRFMLWGRLGYDPDLDRDFFEAILAGRFPQVDAPKLYATWRTASKIVPLINTFHWRDWDHMWSVETCMSKKDGYHSVNAFIEFGPLPGREMQSIDDYVRKPNDDALHPLAVATRLDRLSGEVIDGVDQLRHRTAGRELLATLSDLEAFAHLGAYYADKIRGSTAVHQLRVHGDESHRREALRHLEAALAHWRKYADIASSLYATQLLARTSYTDWNGRLLDFAENDLRIAREAKHHEFPPSVVGSTLGEK